MLDSGAWIKIQPHNHFKVWKTIHPALLGPSWPSPSSINLLSLMDKWDPSRVFYF